MINNNRIMDWKLIKSKHRLFDGHVVYQVLNPWFYYYSPFLEYINMFWWLDMVTLSKAIL